MWCEHLFSVTIERISCVKFDVQFERGLKAHLHGQLSDSVSVYH